MSALALSRLQRWLQAVVVHPGEIEEALGSRRARAALRGTSVDQVILPSRALGPAARVAIYQGMYLLRMEEALQSDYPALKHLLGAERFSALVRDYVESHPSVSYTLNRLGDRLPEFVGRWKGARRPAVCHDLARLELAMAQVFDAEETAALTAAEIASVPAASWERACLAPVAAFRLLAFSYPVNAYVQSVRDEDHDHPSLARKDTWLAIYRRDYAIWRHDLSRPAHDLLADLVAGKPLGRAIAASLGRGGRSAPTADQLFRWFREWAAGGVFRSVRFR